MAYVLIKIHRHPPSSSAVDMWMSGHEDLQLNKHSFFGMLCGEKALKISKLKNKFLTNFKAAVHMK
jgi:hypothetical protein